MERFGKPTYDELESYIENLQKQCADAQATVEALQARLEQEREKVKGLHEITKVICTHCCEPMEIPSKAVLQTQLTQLQALVRALIYSDNAPEHDRAWFALRAALDATTPATKGGDGEGGDGE